jgi:hypothetical protein
MGFKFYTAALVIGMLTTGSINTLAKKMGYETCASSSLSSNQATACAAGICTTGDHHGDDRECPRAAAAAPRASTNFRSLGRRRW